MRYCVQYHVQYPVRYLVPRVAGPKFDEQPARQRTTSWGDSKRQNVATWERGCVGISFICHLSIDWCKTPRQTSLYCQCWVTQTFSANQYSSAPSWCSFVKRIDSRLEQKKTEMELKFDLKEVAELVSGAQESTGTPFKVFFFHGCSSVQLRSGLRLMLEQKTLINTEISLKKRIRDDIGFFVCFFRNQIKKWT